jgi:hypothetical protein
MPDPPAATGLVPESPGPATLPQRPRFSRLLTAVFSGVVAVYVIGLPLGLPVIEGPTSPLAQLERPEDSLDRLAAREMDLRAAMHRHPWEWRLYTVLGGGADSIHEARNWYREAAEALDSPSAALHHAILLAESGQPEQAAEAVAPLGRGGDQGARMARWLDAAYLGAPPDVDTGRELIAQMRRELPASWFADTLVARLAGRIGDARARAQAEAAIVERGRSLLLRVRALTLLGLALFALGAVALGRALGRRRPVRVAVAPLPPIWTAGEGYALFVRGLGAPQAVMLLLVYALHRSLTFEGVIAIASDLPLFWWVATYLRRRSVSMREAFGLGPAPGGGRALLRAALILTALAMAGDALIEWGGSLLQIPSHWSEGLSEEMLWESRGALLLDVFTVVVWAPVVEELTFRGLLYGTLRVRLGPWPAAVLSAMIFALPHGYGILGSASVLMSGMLWALAYERTRSLLPGMLAHAVNNSISTLWTLGMLRL